MSTVAYYRRKVGLSRKELAELAEVNYQTVTYIERGGNFSADIAHRLAQALAQKGLDYASVLAELSNPETRTVKLVRDVQAK